MLPDILKSNMKHSLDLTVEGRRRQMMRWLGGIIDSVGKFEQTQGEGQQSLVCCSPWGRKELDTTELLSNNNNLLLTGTVCVDGEAQCHWRMDRTSGLLITVLLLKGSADGEQVTCIFCLL